MQKPDVRIGVLMTVFEEAEYMGLAIRNIYPYVDYISIVEGSYLEMQHVGATPFSEDGTQDIIEKWRETDKEGKIIYTSFNGETDKVHRNVGTKELIEKGCDWMMIVDGDELIPPELVQLVYKHIHTYIEGQSARVVYFKSQTYINDYKHFTWQYFPRLFKLSDGFRFSDDNFCEYNDSDWTNTRKTTFELIPYHHFAFTKGIKRFEQKKQWWENRFKGRTFRYDWHVEKINGVDKIIPENHKVYELNEVVQFVKEQVGGRVGQGDNG